MVSCWPVALIIILNRKLCCGAATWAYAFGWSEHTKQAKGDVPVQKCVQCGEFLSSHMDALMDLAVSVISSVVTTFLVS